MCRAQWLGNSNRVQKVDTTGTTIYVGALYEKNVSTAVETSYYFAGSNRIAMKQGGVLYYFAADHLGSTSLTMGPSGNTTMGYKPFGETRYGNTPTDRRFTGQRSEEATLGSLYDYGARFYSPVLGRFLSADSIVPGAADGSGGGAATLGYDKNTRLSPLTPDFHEFIGQVTSENQAVLQYGPFFQWSDKVKKDHPVPMGPLNPQALNRYSYVLNNPLRYVDPTGHESYELTKEEIQVLIDLFHGLQQGNLIKGGIAIAMDYESDQLSGSAWPQFQALGEGMNLLSHVIEGETLYSGSELDSIEQVLNQAYTIADKSGTATFTLNPGGFLGLLTDFGCNGCHTTAMIREYNLGIPTGFDVGNPYMLLLRYSLISLTNSNK